MATATKKVMQKPILETTETGTPQKSRRRVSLDEYAIVNEMRPEVKAGFNAWLKGDIFHFDEEWDELFAAYKNRKL